MAVEAFALAPYRVALTRHRVSMATAKPLRVLQISDLHSKGLKSSYHQNQVGTSAGGTEMGNVECT